MPPKTQMWVCAVLGVVCLCQGLLFVLSPESLGGDQSSSRLPFGIAVLLSVPGWFYGAWHAYRRYRKQQAAGTRG